jgi:prepilin-type N-terminal cleavage/methylation domain-containing protein
MRRPLRQSGFTLIELLIVVALLALVAGLIIPNATANLRDQLEGAVEILVGDVALARSLAVANDSSYRIAFDLPNNQYVLTHAGANPTLNELPRSPYGSPSDPADKHIVRLGNLPYLKGAVRLYAVRALSSTPQDVSDVEFGPLGETTRPEPTQIWFIAGTGAATRYLSVRIHPVTGLTWIEDFRASDPLESASRVGP